MFELCKNSSLLCPWRGNIVHLFKNGLKFLLEYYKVILVHVLISGNCNFFFGSDPITYVMSLFELTVSLYGYVVEVTEKSVSREDIMIT